MATKIWQGTVDGDLNDPDNFAPISIRTTEYQWTNSSASANEYYLELAGGGDPGLAEPSKVLAGGSELSAGTLASLSAGEWGYGDVESSPLGYNTIYVRLSDDTDPDTKEEGHVTFKDILKANDDFLVPAGAPQINESLDQSDVTLTSATFEGAAAVGSRTNFLRIKTGAFTFNHTGQAYVDLVDSNIAPHIRNSLGLSGNTYGITLKGSNLTTVSLADGSLKLLGATASEVICEGGDVLVDKDCTVTTLTAIGGTAVCNQTNTLTTGDAAGGTIDLLQSRASRTVTTPKVSNGGTIRSDSDFITFTNSIDGRFEAEAV